MATAPKPGAKSANLQAVPAPEGGDAGSASPAKKSKKKLIIIVAAAVLLAGGGVAAWSMFGADAASDDTAAQTAESTTKAQPPVFIQMESFTVNLQAEGIDQFLQVGFTMQVADPAQVELIKLYMPQVRSRILLLLSSKKANEISTPEGKNLLAKEIAAQVNEPFGRGLPKQTVSDVFFTSFVIQ